MGSAVKIPGWLLGVAAVLGLAGVVLVAGRLPDEVLDRALKAVGIVVLGYVAYSGVRMVITARRQGVPARSIAAAVAFIVALLAVVVFLAGL